MTFKGFGSHKITAFFYHKPKMRVRQAVSMRYGVLPVLHTFPYSVNEGLGKNIPPMVAHRCDNVSYITAGSSPCRRCRHR